MVSTRAASEELDRRAAGATYRAARIVRLVNETLAARRVWLASIDRSLDQVWALLASLSPVGDAPPDAPASVRPGPDAAVGVEPLA